MQYFLRRYHVSRILRSVNAYKLRSLPVQILGKVIELRRKF